MQGEEIIQTDDSDITSIYLGNVPWKASPDEISMLIATKTNVKVKDVRIVKEKGTGRSRGFAFVDLYYNSPDDFIKKAPELVLEGRTLTVKYANERKAKEDMAGNQMQDNVIMRDQQLI